MTPTASPAGVPRAHPSWPRLAAAVGAGVVTGLCFPPVDLGPLVLVALVPLLWTWRGARPAHAALYGFAFGIAAYAVVIPWIRYFGVRGLRADARGARGARHRDGCVGLRVRRVAASRRRSSPPRCGWCSRRCGGRFPLGGFPWADLGVALHDVPAARALASVGGTLLVTS